MPRGDLHARARPPPDARETLRAGHRRRPRRFRADARAPGCRSSRSRRSTSATARAFFAYARAVAVSGTGLGFVPEVAEAWAYGKPVLAAGDAPGPRRWCAKPAAGSSSHATRGRRRCARSPATKRWARWPARAPRTSRRAAAGAGSRRAPPKRSTVSAALEDGRSRDALLAQVAYLYPLVQRQRRTIEAMRVSRFWRLRDGWFAVKRRFGVGPADDPVRVSEGGTREVELAALGDPYQLFREHHRLRSEDVERMRSMARFLPNAVEFALVIDARGARDRRRRATLRQPARSSVRALDGARAGRRRGRRGRRRAGRAGRAGRAHRVVAAGRRPLRQRPASPARSTRTTGSTRTRCSSSRWRSRTMRTSSTPTRTASTTAASRATPGSSPTGRPRRFSPATTSGDLCVMRRELLERAGGVRDVFESAKWYEALLRVTEQTDRVAHVAQVLCHRSVGNIGRQQRPRAGGRSRAAAARRSGQRPARRRRRRRALRRAGRRAGVRHHPDPRPRRLAAPVHRVAVPAHGLPQLRGARRRQRQPRRGDATICSRDWEAARTRPLSRAARSVAVQLLAPQQRSRARDRRRSSCCCSTTTPR